MPERASRLVVVPMKDPALAKTRLAGTLDDRQRAAFARSLYVRTLETLTDLRADVGADAFDLAVVTGSAAVRGIAGALAVAIIDEGAQEGLNEALRKAVLFADERDYRSLAVLPADLASPRLAELRSFLTHPLDAHRMIACPSMDMGTNALLVSPPDGLDFAFGPRSFVRHMRVAETAGLRPMALPLESLKWDIDSTDDLARLLDADPKIAESWTEP